MKYLILLYNNPASLDFFRALSNEEKREAVRGHTALSEALTESGELILSEALADPLRGTGVARRDGRTVTTDGPFAEAKEYLAGFYLVECASEERVLEIAARVPEAEYGTVEVRPVQDLSYP